MYVPAETDQSIHIGWVQTVVESTRDAETPKMGAQLLRAVGWDQMRGASGRPS